MSYRLEILVLLFIASSFYLALVNFNVNALDELWRSGRTRCYFFEWTVCKVSCFLLLLHSSPTADSYQIGFVSKPSLSNYSVSLGPKFNEEYGILVRKIPLRLIPPYSCNYTVTGQCLVYSSRIPHEEPWYSSPSIFQREDWYFKRFIFILGKNGLMNWLREFRIDIWKCTSFHILLNYREHNRSISNALYSSYPYSAVSIHFVNNSDSPFLYAHNICVNSKLEWSIYLRCESFNVHYPKPECTFLKNWLWL